MLQERSLMIGHIGVISWNMQILQQLFSTGNQINLLLFTDPIMFGFDEYNSRLSIEDKHTPDYLLLCKYPEGHIHESDLLNLIPCGIYLASTPFSDTEIITYKIELPPYGKRVGFNLLNDEDFKTPYILDTIPN